MERPDSTSPYFFVCDHYGNRIPRKLGQLGVSDDNLQRHIAWDVGVAGMAEEFARRFDATLVKQLYSRLVIDCNRPLDSPTSIPEISEDTEIPGNRGISPEEVAARRREIFAPYHDTIASLLDRRLAAGQPTILLALHTFTPVYHGEKRPWHIGLLYNRDARLARLFLKLLAEDETLCLGDNQPYTVDDFSDYSIPVHGEGRGIPHLLFELRHDMIEEESDQYRWAHRLAGSLERALEHSPELAH
ncbi:MAG: N-formylglutamate amidohydrolase [Halieaceae bacterium]|nr:N-formylglutamate amidohydrolase [Halieaceae bacterium]